MKQEKGPQQPKPKPRLDVRPKFCETCPLYRKAEGCRLQKDLWIKSPTNFARRVEEWNKKVSLEPQSVVNECSKL